jgi:hypothetical protein
MKALADEQSGVYREIGILVRLATGTGLGRMPAASTSSVNQIVISPRCRNALLYSGQLVAL